jgi:hypothetical protein
LLRINPKIKICNERPTGSRTSSSATGSTGNTKPGNGNDHPTRFHNSFPGRGTNNPPGGGGGGTKRPGVSNTAPGDDNSDALRKRVSQLRGSTQTRNLFLRILDGQAPINDQNLQTIVTSITGTSGLTSREKEQLIQLARDLCARQDTTQTTNRTKDAVSPNLISSLDLQSPYSLLFMYDGQITKVAPEERLPIFGDFFEAGMVSLLRWFKAEEGEESTGLLKEILNNLDLTKFQTSNKDGSISNPQVLIALREVFQGLAPWSTANTETKSKLSNQQRNKIYNDLVGPYVLQLSRLAESLSFYPEDHPIHELNELGIALSNLEKLSPGYIQLTSRNIGGQMFNFASGLQQAQENQMTVNQRNSLRLAEQFFCWLGRSKMGLQSVDMVRSNNLPTLRRPHTASTSEGIVHYMPPSIVLPSHGETLAGIQRGRNSANSMEETQGSDLEISLLTPAGGEVPQAIRQFLNQEVFDHLFQQLLETEGGFHLAGLQSLPPSGTDFVIDRLNLLPADVLNFSGDVLIGIDPGSDHPSARSWQGVIESIRDSGYLVIKNPKGNLGYLTAEERDVIGDMHNISQEWNRRRLEESPFADQPWTAHLIEGLPGQADQSVLQRISQIPEEALIYDNNGLIMGIQADYANPNAHLWQQLIQEFTDNGFALKSSNGFLEPEILSNQPLFSGGLFREIADQWRDLQDNLTSAEAMFHSIKLSLPELSEFETIDDLETYFRGLLVNSIIFAEDQKTILGIRRDIVENSSQLEMLLSKLLDQNQLLKLFNGGLAIVPDTELSEKDTENLLSIIESRVNPSTDPQPKSPVSLPPVSPNTTPQENINPSVWLESQRTLGMSPIEIANLLSTRGDELLETDEDTALLFYESADSKGKEPNPADQWILDNTYLMEQENQGDALLRSARAIAPSNLHLALLLTKKASEEELSSYEPLANYLLLKFDNTLNDKRKRELVEAILNSLQGLSEDELREVQRYRLDFIPTQKIKNEELKLLLNYFQNYSSSLAQEDKELVTKLAKAYLARGRGEAAKRILDQYNSQFISEPILIELNPSYEDLKLINFNEEGTLLNQELFIDLLSVLENIGLSKPEVANKFYTKLLEVFDYLHSERIDLSPQNLIRLLNTALAYQDSSLEQSQTAHYSRTLDELMVNIEKNLNVLRSLDSHNNAPAIDHATELLAELYYSNGMYIKAHRVILDKMLPDSSSAFDSLIRRATIELTALAWSDRPSDDELQRLVGLLGLLESFEGTVSPHLADKFMEAVLKLRAMHFSSRQKVEFLNNQFGSDDCDWTWHLVDLCNSKFREIQGTKYGSFFRTLFDTRTRLEGTDDLQRVKKTPVSEFRISEYHQTSPLSAAQYMIDNYFNYPTEMLFGTIKEYLRAIQDNNQIQISTSLDIFNRLAISNAALSFVLDCFSKDRQLNTDADFLTLTEGISAKTRKCWSNAVSHTLDNLSTEFQRLSQNLGKTEFDFLSQRRDVIKLMNKLIKCLPEEQAGTMMYLLSLDPSIQDLTLNNLGQYFVQNNPRVQSDFTKLISGLSFLQSHYIDGLSVGDPLTINSDETTTYAELKNFLVSGSANLPTTIKDGCQIYYRKLLDLLCTNMERISRLNLLEGSLKEALRNGLDPTYSMNQRLINSILERFRYPEDFQNIGQTVYGPLLSFQIDIIETLKQYFEENTVQARLFLVEKTEEVLDTISKFGYNPTSVLQSQYKIIARKLLDYLFTLTPPTGLAEKVEIYNQMVSLNEYDLMLLAHEYMSSGFIDDNRLNQILISTEEGLAQLSNSYRAKLESSGCVFQSDGEITLPNIHLQPPVTTSIDAPQDTAGQEASSPSTTTTTPQDTAGQEASSPSTTTTTPQDTAGQEASQSSTTIDAPQDTLDQGASPLSTIIDAPQDTLDQEASPLSPTIDALQDTTVQEASLSSPSIDPLQDPSGQGHPSFQMGIKVNGEPLQEVGDLSELLHDQPPAFFNPDIDQGEFHVIPPSSQTFDNGDYPSDGQIQSFTNNWGLTNEQYY